MFKRRKKGKSFGNWYFWHPVTGRRESTGTDDRALAKAIVAKAERESVERRAGIFVPSFDQQCDSWLELNQALASRATQEVQGGFWKQHLGSTPLNQITRELAHDIIKQNRPVTLDAPSKANNTANQYMHFLAKIIRSGKVQPPDFYKYPSRRRSPRWLRREEWHALVAVMQDELRQAATFSLATGLREANVMRFEWSWIHGDCAYLPREVTKTDEDYGIPLNRAALQVIEERRAAPVRGLRYVFMNGGEQWTQHAYYDGVVAAAKAAGIPHVTVHTLRHTFASWIAQLGVPDSIRKRLGCWSLYAESGGSAATYVHFDVESLRPFSQKLDPLILTSVPPLEQVVEVESKTASA